MITEITPNGVEKWAEWLDIQPKSTRLNDEQMRIFTSMSFNEDAVEKDKATQEFVSTPPTNLAAVFYNRIKLCHTYEITIGAALFLSSIISNLGEATMYANYLQYKAKKLNLKRITMKDIGMKLFPFGFFSKDTMRIAWERQKCKIAEGSDNLLDHGIAQQSIIIEDKTQKKSK